jgi:hypothetical protein
LVDYLRISTARGACFDQVCYNPEEQGICKVVEGQEETLKDGGMVFTRAARLRWEKVADYLCEIVQRILGSTRYIWSTGLCLNDTPRYARPWSTPQYLLLPNPCMMWLYRCALKRTQSLSLL